MFLDQKSPFKTNIVTERVRLKQEACNVADIWLKVVPWRICLSTDLILQQVHFDHPTLFEIALLAGAK